MALRNLDRLLLESHHLDVWHDGTSLVHVAALTQMLVQCTELGHLLELDLDDLQKVPPRLRQIASLRHEVKFRTLPPRGAPRVGPPCSARIRIITLTCMRLAMDSDWLIKLTKAGLKESVCQAWTVTIPPAVHRETVHQAVGRPDAARIENNIAAGHLTVAVRDDGHGKGDDAVLSLYEAGGFDAVATDDARLIRHLRGLGVPYAVPAVLIVALRQQGSMSADEAAQALSALQPHVSADEYASAQLMLRSGDMP